MVSLRLGIGGFGVLCLSAAALMLLEQYGALRGPEGEFILAGFAVGIAGLSLWCILRCAPAGAPPQTQAAARSDKVDTGADAGAAGVRLIPRLPGGAGVPRGSWLGGCPDLPEGADWPVIGGQPGQFLAQIDCAALPAALWNGAGPRRGALVFFRAARPAGADLPVHVMHVEGRLSRRAPPRGVEKRPHWPLMVQAAAEATDRADAPEPDWPLLHAADLSHAGFQPFDWASARMLLGAMNCLIGTLAGQFGAKGAAQVAQAEAGLAALYAALDAARNAGDFGAGVQTMLRHGLAALHLPGPPSAAGDSAPVPLLRHRMAAGYYFSAFERHCRRVYTEDPARLPAAQRALFEPFWAHNARHETGCIGTEHAPGLSDDGAAGDLLLELPSSELLGWMFGEARALRIYARPDDLARGALDRAWSSVAA